MKDMYKPSPTNFGVFLLAAVVVGSPIAAVHPPLAIAPFNTDQAKQFQQAWAKHIGKPLVYTNSIGMKLVLLPPGEFVMGLREKGEYEKLRQNLLRSKHLIDRNTADHGGLLEEMPAHRVRLTKPFYLGCCEVTFGQFRQFADETGYKTDAERGLVYGKPYKGERPIRTFRTPVYPDRPANAQQPRENDPVMHVDWNDCMAFCEWLSKKDADKGYEYSLPTSAQWEYACRAGTTTLWYFGDEDAFDKVGHEYELISWREKSPNAVGQRKPNPFGLHDMHGNMMEWMRDWLNVLYYLECPLNDPTGPVIPNEATNRRRLVRGGAFEVGRYWSRSSWGVRIARGSNQHRHPGFRVAMYIKDVEGVPPAPEPNLRIVGDDKSPADPVAAQAAAVTKDRPKELQIKLDKDVSMEFVLVPAGSFLMGSLKGGRFERPVHEVTISKPFYIGKYEVTQGQWDAVMGAKDRVRRWGKYPPKLPEHLGPDQPMFKLNWIEWQEFVEKIRSKVPARDFRLPTEAQWEYACRAGSRTEYCFDDDPALLREFAGIGADDALRWRDRKLPDLIVTGKKPNNWGIYDMHGSLWEWCEDWWDKDYYSHSPRVDPQGPENGNFKVLRGGTLEIYGRFARSGFRFFRVPDLVVSFRYHPCRTGARLAINLSE